MEVDELTTSHMVRRVVTGHDQAGVAKVLIDAPASNKKVAASGAVSTLIWSSDRAPASIEIGEPVADDGMRTLGTAPPACGSRFAVIDIPPHASGAMHRTDTLDYVIIMEGEVEMALDASTVTMKKGDVMVQRGTNHSWINRSDKTVRIAFVLLDATPIGVGAPLTGAVSAQ